MNEGKQMSEEVSGMAFQNKKVVVRIRKNFCCAALTQSLWDAFLYDQSQSTSGPHAKLHFLHPVQLINLENIPLQLS